MRNKYIQIGTNNGACVEPTLTYSPTCHYRGMYLVRKGKGYEGKKKKFPKERVNLVNSKVNE